MDFAADAVLDVITPPARPAPARDATPAPDDGPSFDDHLDAATRESETSSNDEAPRPEQGANTPATNGDTDPADHLLGGEAAPIAPPEPQVPAEQTTPQVFVQLIADATMPAQHAEQPATTPSAAPATTPGAPSQAGPAPMLPAANTQDTPAPIDVAPAATKPEATKSDASVEKNTAPTTPQQTAPASAQPQTTPATSASIAVTPADPGAEMAEAPPPMAIAPMQAQPAPEHAARQAKSAPAPSDMKSESAAPVHNAAPAATAAPRTNAKAGAPQNAAKDAAAFASLLDAPEAAPQQQAASAAGATAASSTHSQHATAEQSAARAAPAAHQVAREIARKFDGGNTRFELRLDPPELGRVEVRLDVSRDHRVTAVIAADNPQALTELARHARELEQMLQGAGLELGDNGLSFDLRQGNERAETAEFTGATGAGAAQVGDTAPIAARPLGYERWRGVRVDMMV